MLKPLCAFRDELRDSTHNLNNFQKPINSTRFRDARKRNTTKYCLIFKFATPKCLSHLMHNPKDKYALRMHTHISSTERSLLSSEKKKKTANSKQLSMAWDNEPFHLSHLLTYWNAIESLLYRKNSEIKKIMNNILHK